MIAIQTVHNFDWVDCTNPDQSEMTEVLEKYGISIDIDTVLDFSQQSHVEHTEDYTYCIFRFPRMYRDETEPYRTSFEVDIIVTKHALITIHDIPLFEIESVDHRLDFDEIEIHHPLELACAVLNEFYQTVRTELAHISDQFELTETEIFDDYRKSAIERVSLIGKHVIDIERSVRLHQYTIDRLEKIYTTLRGSQLLALQKTIDSFHEISAQLHINRVILDELTKMHSALLTRKTNSFLMRLTIINFLMLPLSFAVDISWIVYRVELGAFMLPLLALIGLVILCILYMFYEKKWL